MLSMILAAAIGQITPDDYMFSRAQEHFVIDNLTKDQKAYSLFVPKEILEQVDRFGDDCYRCRKRANEAVVAMGLPALRWLFWTERSTDLRIQMHSRACQEGIVRCSWCGGSGVCAKYEADESNAIEWQRVYCKTCGRNAQNHDDPSWPLTCEHCSGNGVFQRVEGD